MVDGGNQMESDWNKLIRKRVLVKIGWTNLQEMTVEEISPSGNHIKLDKNWYRYRDVHLIEVLN